MPNVVPVLRAALVQGVLDARTLHQSVFSRLVQEQREGLRDSWGLLKSRPSPSLSTSSPPVPDLHEYSSLREESSGGTETATTATSNGGISHEEGSLTGRPATAAVTGADAAGAEGAGEEQEMDSEEGWMEQEGEHGERAEKEGEDGSIRSTESADTSSAAPSFSFLESGFDEATLGGMRTPPFSLPRVLVGEGFVQV